MDETEAEAGPTDGDEGVDEKRIWERAEAGRTGAASGEVEGFVEAEEVDLLSCDERVEEEKECVVVATREAEAAVWGNGEARDCRAAQLWPRLAASALRKAARSVG